MNIAVVDNVIFVYFSYYVIGYIIEISSEGDLTVGPKNTRTN